jgi:cytochrome oxidase assembly protein ShyY1
MGETMIEKLMTLLVGILLALAGWSLSRTFELSTIQAVHEDKVHTLQQQVLKLEDQVDGMMDKDKEIIEQHKKLFEVLDNNQPSTGYSYN